jgi:hypothetical protein
VDFDMAVAPDLNPDTALFLCYFQDGIKNYFSLFSCKNSKLLIRQKSVKTKIFLILFCFLIIGSASIQIMTDLDPNPRDLITYG